jgi:hypothetical protein
MLSDPTLVCSRFDSLSFTEPTVCGVWFKSHTENGRYCAAAAASLARTRTVPPPRRPIGFGCGSRR